MAAIQARRLVGGVSTPTLALSYRELDEMLERARSRRDSDMFQYLAASRGWILDELEARGDLHRVGLCAGCLADLDQCDCVDGRRSLDV